MFCLPSLWNVVRWLLSQQWHCKVYNSLKMWMKRNKSYFFVYVMNIELNLAVSGWNIISLRVKSDGRDPNTKWPTITSFIECFSNEFPTLCFCVPVWFGHLWTFVTFIIHLACTYIYILITIKVSKMTKVTSQALYKKNIEIKEYRHSSVHRANLYAYYW